MKTLTNMIIAGVVAALAVDFIRTRMMNDSLAPTPASGAPELDAPTVFNSPLWTRPADIFRQFPG